MLGHIRGQHLWARSCPGALEAWPPSVPTRPEVFTEHDQPVEFPGRPASTEGGTGLIPGQGTKIPPYAGGGEKNPAPTTPSQRTALLPAACLSQTQTRPSPNSPRPKATFRTVPAPRPAHHVDDHLAQALPLALAEVLEDVTVVFLQQLEAHGQVVILQHRLVIVHERQFRIWGPSQVGAVRGRDDPPRMPPAGRGQRRPRPQPSGAPPPAQQAPPSQRAAHWC